jgi:hypothetical protein
MPKSNARTMLPTHINANQAEYSVVSTNGIGEREAEAEAEADDGGGED